MKNVGELVDIDPAGGDVGGDEMANLFGAEAGHDLLAFLLRQIARDHRDRQTLTSEKRGYRADFAARVAEDHRRRGLVELDDLVEDPLLVRRRSDDVGVAHFANVGEVFGERHPFRVLQVVVDEPADSERNGRREQTRVPLGGDERHDLAHLLGEAHVEHLVGFVEDESAHAIELQLAALQQVEDPPGRPHDDLSASADAVDLFSDGLTAVDRLRVQTATRADAAELFADLRGELPRGR